MPEKKSNIVLVRVIIGVAVTLVSVGFALLQIQSNTSKDFEKKIEKEVTSYAYPNVEGVRNRANIENMEEQLTRIEKKSDKIYDLLLNGNK